MTGQRSGWPVATLPSLMPVPTLPSLVPVATLAATLESSLMLASIEQPKAIQRVGLVSNDRLLK